MQQSLHTRQIIVGQEYEAGIISEDGYVGCSQDNLMDTRNNELLQRGMREGLEHITNALASAQDLDIPQDVQDLYGHNKSHGELLLREPFLLSYLKDSELKKYWVQEIEQKLKNEEEHRLVDALLHPPKKVKQNYQQKNRKCA